MANGNVVRLPCTPVELPATFDESLGGAERWIGAIVIELVDVAMNAVREIGRRAWPRTRSQGGDLVAGLVMGAPDERRLVSLTLPDGGLSCQGPGCRIRGDLFSLDFCSRAMKLRAIAMARLPCSFRQTSSSSSSSLDLHHPARRSDLPSDVSGSSRTISMARSVSDVLLGARCRRCGLHLPWQSWFLLLMRTLIRSSAWHGPLLTADEEAGRRRPYGQ